jgi:hypothetical protein
MDTDKIAVFRVNTSIHDDSDEVLVCCLEVSKSDIKFYSDSTEANDAYSTRITDSGAFKDVANDPERVRDILNSTYGIMIRSTLSKSLDDTQFADMIKKFKVTKSIKVGK